MGHQSLVGHQNVGHQSGEHQILAGHQIIDVYNKPKSATNQSDDKSHHYDDIGCQYDDNSHTYVSIAQPFDDTKNDSGDRILSPLGGDLRRTGDGADTPQSGVQGRKNYRLSGGNFVANSGAGTNYAANSGGSRSPHGDRSHDYGVM